MEVIDIKDDKIIILAIKFHFINTIDQNHFAYTP